jgi:tRNA threonylcarbamoyladenosine biosynthesis protein TsaE
VHWPPPRDSAIPWADVSTAVTTTPDETVAAGRALAARLPPGSTVALSGELGAGKTHFVRGMVGGWGGAEDATSPTFTLVHEYATPRGPVFHFDLYRAESAEEIWASAHDELENSDGLVVVEWADRFPALLPPDAVRVTIAHHGEGRRLITIAP